EDRVANTSSRLAHFRAGRLLVLRRELVVAELAGRAEHVGDLADVEPDAVLSTPIELHAVQLDRPQRLVALGAVDLRLALVGPHRRRGMGLHGAWHVRGGDPAP